MNKELLISAIAEEAKLTKKDAEAFIDAFVKVVPEGVKEYGKVQLIGFGSFEKRERNAREGRNPKTQEIIQIEATTTVGFKAGKIFKEAVK